MEENAIFAGEPVRAVTVPEQTGGWSQAVRERAEVMGKWMWIYFWVQIVSVIPGIIGAVAQAAESSTLFGDILSWGLSAVLVVCLFRMGAVQERLRVCAILNVVALVLSLGMEFVGNEILNGIITLAAGIVGLVTTYQFMHGCGDALAGVDSEQSGKWYRLWKWYIWLLVGGVIGIFVIGICTAVIVAVTESGLIGILAVIAIFGWAIAVIVQVVREIVYVYRTAQIFRGIAANP